MKRVVVKSVESVNLLRRLVADTHDELHSGEIPSFDSVLNQCITTRDDVSACEIPPVSITLKNYFKIIMLSLFL